MLVLGSMPGQASLRAQQYYAHPQNAFWRIAGAVLGFDPQAPYAKRKAALVASGVALWDVLAACTRPGSLDADIVHATAVPNDFEGILARRPGIVRICFNGATAEAMFHRHVTSRGRIGRRLELVRLPSTSAAHASLSEVAKLAAWQAIRPPAV